MAHLAQNPFDTLMLLCMEEITDDIDILLHVYNVYIYLVRISLFW